MRRNENDMMPSQYNEKESWKSPTRGMTPNTRPKTATPGLRLNRNPKTVHSFAQRRTTRFVFNAPKPRRTGFLSQGRPVSGSSGPPAYQNCATSAMSHSRGTPQSENRAQSCTKTYRPVRRVTAVNLTNHMQLPENRVRFARPPQPARHLSPAGDTKPGNCAQFCTKMHNARRPRPPAKLASPRPTGLIRVHPCSSMAKLLTKTQSAASNLGIRCEPTTQALRYKGMTVYTLVPVLLAGIGLA
jgi:hypothetical protein